jgi:hypothetical protein
MKTRNETAQRNHLEKRHFVALSLRATKPQRKNMLGGKTVYLSALYRSLRATKLCTKTACCSKQSGGFVARNSARGATSATSATNRAQEDPAPRDPNFQNQRI